MPNSPHSRPGSGTETPTVATLAAEDAPYAAWLAQDLPLSETPLARTFEMLARLTPVRAGQLAEQYERDVRPALRHARDAEPYENTQREKANAVARRENQAIDAQQAAVREARDVATLADCQELQRLRLPLAEAHVLAANAESAADGAEYDPQNPCDERVLNISMRPLEAIAPGLGLPVPTSQRDAGMAHVAIAVFGAVLGVSYGIVFGVLRVGALGSSPVVLLGCLLAGAALASMWHLALRQFPYLAAERYYQPGPLGGWLLLALLGVATFCVFVWVDSVSVSMGLFKFAQTHLGTASLRRAAAHLPEQADLKWFLLAMFCSFPFGLLAMREGFFAGRAHQINGRLLEAQRQECEVQEAHRRSQPAVARALQAVALVRSIMHYVSQIQRRIDETAAPFEERIARLEARRLPIRAELDEAAWERVRIARAKALVALGEWRTKLEAVASQYVRPRPPARMS